MEATLPALVDEYNPRLYAIDDYSLDTLDFTEAMAAIERLGLRRRLNLVKDNFVGSMPRLNLTEGELDMVWFDAKSVNGTLADFLIEYWNLLRPDGGVMLVHYTAGYDQESKQWWRIDVRQLVVSLGLALEDQVRRILV